MRRGNKMFGFKKKEIKEPKKYNVKTGHIKILLKPHKSSDLPKRIILSISGKFIMKSTLHSTFTYVNDVEAEFKEYLKRVDKASFVNIGSNRWIAKALVESITLYKITDLWLERK